jgi:hypothetical protein
MKLHLRLVVLGLAASMPLGCATPPTKPAQTPGPGCPEDARVCADGSTVVREGPSCAFAPCPEDDEDPPASPASPPSGGGFAPDPAPDNEVSPKPMGTFDRGKQPPG